MRAGRGRGDVDDLNDQRRNRGPRVRLTAVEQRHLPALWELIQDPEVSRRWRTAGASVSPEEFSSTFWDGVLVQHLAVDAEGGQPVAWLICYDANHRQSRAYFAVVGFPEFLATRALRDAIHLFIDYLFETWPFRQVLIDVPEFNLQGIEHAILRAGERVAVIPRVPLHVRLLVEPAHVRHPARRAARGAAAAAAARARGPGRGGSLRVRRQPWGPDLGARPWRAVSPPRRADGRRSGGCRRGGSSPPPSACRSSRSSRTRSRRPRP